MMPDKIKAAIIGAGNIGFRYSLDPLRFWVSSHLQAYKEHPRFEPMAICDIDKNKLKAAQSYLPSLNIYTSWREMLKREKIDILSVCVSPKLNLEVCESCFLKNIKALILEKPFAQDASAGRRIIRALQSKGAIAAVNYYRRWQETFWKAKEIISSGRIGKILKVNAVYPKGIWSGGAHIIDALHYLLGDFTSLQALGRMPAGPKTDPLYSVFAHIGATEVFLFGFDKHDFNIFEIEIFGTKGKIVVSDFGSKIILWGALSSRRFSNQKELFIIKEIAEKGDNPYFFNLLDNVSALLKNKSERVLCSPQDALKTTIAICAIEDSYKYEKKISLTWR